MFKKLLVGVLLTLLIVIDAVTYADTIQKEIANNVIRLHVIANSDSEEDQELKLKVRDAILIYMKEIDYPTRNVAYKSLWKSLEDIEQIATNIIVENGFNYTAKVELGEFDFPTKEYEQYSFPAGKYTAVRIKIGEAKGQNWWCVMYPSLCLNDDTTDATTQLQNNLSKESFDVITNNCKIKFKIVDWIEGIKK